MLIREASTHRDLDEAVQVQREVWGVADIDIAGRIQLRASQHAGGSVLIAETPDGAVAGFAYAFPAFVEGETFWHSDMLAVRPEFRGTGLGQALKWKQRERALALGLKRITWTFDPMQAKNAHLNLDLLGASVAEFLPDFYGVTTSALHHGLATDRLLASWELDSDRVAMLAGGETPPPPRVEAQVAIPRDWNELVATDPGAARSEQRRVGHELETAFARGHRAEAFDRETSAYLLGPVKRP